MKKQILIGAATLLSAGCIFFTSCKKDDTSGPTITLNGTATEKSILNAAYTDPGATAKDDEDGVVQVTTTGTVNKDLAGAYVITYSASDAAGNTNTATRTVTVYNEAETLAGNYLVVDSVVNYKVFHYAQTITVDTKLNNRIHFDRFADYDNNSSIYADLNATTITLTSQTATGIDSLNETHTFAGTGATIINGFDLTYTDYNKNTNSTAQCIAVFTKK